MRTADDLISGCLAALEHATVGFMEVDGSIKDKLASDELNDQADRFRLWMEDVGAHSEGKRSLDHHLRDSANVRGCLVRLLVKLHSSVEMATKVIDRERAPRRNPSDADRNSVLDEIGHPEESTMSPDLHHLVVRVEKIITCLMRLSLSIKTPAPSGQSQISLEATMSDHDLTQDTDLVRNAFPKAPERLIVRLGQANLSRREDLHYHKERHGGSRQTPLSSRGGAEAMDITDVPSASGIGDWASFTATTGPSQSATADEQGDVSMRNARTHAGAHFITLPASVRLGEPFECPTCFEPITVLQSADWTKHIFEDLRPYVRRL